ncbi:MAG: hypothetical protein HW414_1061 [Dehalococcoidia bacterium]|nr:hypothetical protein [Dehalococcoidia bacterium]
MRRYFIVAFVTLSLLILSNGCAGATPKPATTPAPVTKPAPTPTPAPAPAPSPKPAAEAPVISVNLDANVGTPPSEGWKWVVAEINTAAEEVKENPNAHGFFWSFFTVKGSHEVTMGSDIKMVQSGEAVLVQARQQHSHRYLPQSKVLVFDLRTVYDMPDSYHRGTQLPVPDNALDTKKGADLKLRVRTFVLAPGSRTSEAITSDPNFGYVMEGTHSGGCALVLSSDNPRWLVIGTRPFASLRVTNRKCHSEHSEGSLCYGADLCRLALVLPAHRVAPFSHAFRYPRQAE